MLSILMPVYNERERVEQAITEVLQTQLPTEFEQIGRASCRERV